MPLIILVVEKKKSAIFQCSLTTYLFIFKENQITKELPDCYRTSLSQNFSIFHRIFFLYFYATLNRDLSSISSMETSAKIFIKLIKQK